MPINYGLSKGSFHEMRARFDEALAWLRTHHVGLSRPRLKTYYRNLDAIIDAIDNNSTAKLMAEGKFFDFLSTVHEVNQIIVICEGLKYLKPQHALTTRLRKSLGGPPFTSDESTVGESHQGRDFAFELMVGSLFTRAKYEWDPSSTTDVALAEGPIRLKIECKRPSSDKTVGNCTKGAIVQLEDTLRSVEPGDTTYGIIALSVDRAVVPKGKFLEISGNRAITRRLADELTKFSNKHRNHWRGPIHPRIIGVLLFIHTVCIIKSENVPTSALFSSLEPTVSHGNLYYSVYESVSRRLERSLGGPRGIVLAN